MLIGGFTASTDPGEIVAIAFTFMVSASVISFCFITLLLKQVVFIENGSVIN
jgi:hypothetical protein